MTTTNDIELIGPDGAELARYRISAGERVLSGWRRGSGIEVVDRPANGRARGYVVDRGFRCPRQLQAFLGDYVDQARRLDACPMGSEALESLIVDSESEALDSLLDKGGLR